jgi:hypothetical protein
MSGERRHPGEKKTRTSRTCAAPFGVAQVLHALSCVKKVLRRRDQPLAS